MFRLFPYLRSLGPLAATLAVGLAGGWVGAGRADRAGDGGEEPAVGDQGEAGAADSAGRAAGSTRSPIGPAHDAQAGAAEEAVMPYKASRRPSGRGLGTCRRRWP